MRASQLQSIFVNRIESFRFLCPSIELDGSPLKLDNTGFYPAQPAQSPYQAGDTLHQLDFDDAERIELLGYRKA